MIESELLLIGAIATFVWVTGWWLYSLWKKDASVIDIAWGPGFALIAWCIIISEVEILGSQLIVTILVSIWAARLAGHILWRKKDFTEDWRYQAMRKRSGKSFWWKSYFKVFLLQGLLMNIIALPLYMLALSDTYEQPFLVVAGGLIWLVGFFFESVGDWQLSRFLSKKSNKGKIMDQGVWQYTRHPNYFGEMTMWWGLWITTMTVDKGIWALASPVLITFLLLKVSGITMLEKKYDKNKKYQAYKSKVSPIIPLPPKK